MHSAVFGTGFHFGIMENQIQKKVESEMEALGPFEGVCRDVSPIMENQMEKKHGT